MTSYSYLDSENKVTITDPDQEVTVDMSDGLSRLTTQIVASGPLNLMTTYTYDADGNVHTMTDADGNTTTYIYDGLDRQIEIDYPATPDDTAPVKEQFFYDGDNNLVTVIDKRGIVTMTTYDNLNRVLSQQLVESISNNGTPLTLSSYVYIDKGSNGTHSVVKTDADGYVTTTQYDALDRATLITDPMGFTIKETYDGVNLPRKSIPTATRPTIPTTRITA